MADDEKEKEPVVVPKGQLISEVPTTPKPILTSLREQFEYNVDTATQVAKNKYAAEMVKTAQLEGAYKSAVADYQREKGRLKHVDIEIALDKRNLEAELAEAIRRKDTALAKADEIDAEHEARQNEHTKRKLEAVAAQRVAEVAALEAEIRLQELRARLDRANATAEQLDKQRANLEARVDETRMALIKLDERVEALLIEDTEVANSEKRALDAQRVRLKGQLVKFETRLDELEGL